MNDVLNETASDGDWKTMGGGEFTTERMNELVGGQYAEMMKGDSPSQIPSVNPNDPMSEFLNKDYSEVLKKADEKDNQNSDYLVNHSAITYLMSDKGQFIIHFSYGTTAKEMAAKLDKIL